MVFFDNSKFRKKIDEYRALGYMTAPEIARAYDISSNHARNLMAEPDKTILNPTPVNLYLKTRVSEVFAQSKKVKK